MKRADNPFMQGVYFQRLNAEAKARRESPKGKAGQRGGWIAARTYPVALRPRDSRGRFAPRDEKGAGKPEDLNRLSDDRAKQRKSA